MFNLQSEISNLDMAPPAPCGGFAAAGYNPAPHNSRRGSCGAGVAGVGGVGRRGWKLLLPLTMGSAQDYFERLSPNRGLVAACRCSLTIDVSNGCGSADPLIRPVQRLVGDGFYLCITRDSDELTKPDRSTRAVSISLGEFDPGSGRTLAACLTHASRTGPARVQWRTGA